MSSSADKILVVIDDDSVGAAERKEDVEAGENASAGGCQAESKEEEDDDVIEMFGGDGDSGGDGDCDGGDDDRDSDVIEMFGGSDDSGGEGADPMRSSMASPSSAPPARKRRKTGRDSLDKTTRATKRSDREPPAINDEDTQLDAAEKERMLNLAKSKLSKWAARLFDPDRPRGLVEPPQTIPLNDEFLEAFGRREKDFDIKTGRETEIDRVDLDKEEDHGDGAVDEPGRTAVTASGRKRKKTDDLEEGCKVKIINLAYATPQSSLLPACEKYGPVVDCNLIMDNNNRGSGLSTGRAYVTFESPEYAELCIREMNDKVRLDRRTLRVALAEMKPQKAAGGEDGGKSKRGGPPGAGTSRYWEKDISTKCFRCGGVGHTAAKCTNPEKPKPCPMCAEAEPDHSEWGCPKRTWCFHCGVPGHVSRECPERFGGRQSRPINRKACGNCFQSGHHRWQCRQHSSAVMGGSFGTDSARCMQCGRFGHFSCEPLKWFFGLKGNYCFNCGVEGHHGIDCKRPTLEQFGRDKEAIEREIEQVEALALEEELRKQQERSRGRDRYDGGGSSGRGRQRSREDDYGGDGDKRAKSHPPPEMQRNRSDSGRRGYGDSNGGGHRRRYSDGEGGGNRHGRRHSDEGRRYGQGSGSNSQSRSGGGGRSRTY